MTPHLRDTEFVDLLDGALPAPRVRHVEGCDACRAAAAEMSQTLEGARAADVPEPPAFFWPQFSERVRLAVAAESEPRPGLWQLLENHRVRWGALAALAVVLLAVATWRLMPAQPAPDTPSVASAPVEQAPAAADASVTTVFDAFADVDSDEAWALVRTMADDLALAPEDIDAAGLAPRTGTVDHVAASLSDRERTELARLLEDALKQRRAMDSSS